MSRTGASEPARLFISVLIPVRACAFFSRWRTLVLTETNTLRYYSREAAFNAIRYINGTRLDNRIIRTDFDQGFSEGRQFGRGKSGGQVRDEYRDDFDPGRGGFGKQTSPSVSNPPVSYTKR
ncbi:hypothetical protein QZH41_016679 [Actinostola sp. cb2023]|nr:hypothetical protein QZH41_016679 [Actinostola sp. cb2023]